MQELLIDGRTDIAVAPQNALEWLRTQDLPKRDAKFYERVDGKWKPVARATTNNYRPILVAHKGRQRVLLYPTSNSLAVENNPSLNDAGMILGNPDVLAKKDTLGADALIQRHNGKGAIKVSIQKNASLRSVAPVHSSQALDGRTDIAVAPQNVLEWLRTQDLPERNSKFYERVDGKWKPVADETTKNYRPILVEHKGGQRVLLYPTSNSLAVENNPSLNDAGMILGNPNVLAKRKTLDANALVQRHNEKGAIKVCTGKNAFILSVQALDGRTDIAVAPQNVLEWLRTQDLPKRDAKFYERVDGKWNPVARRTTNNYRPILVAHKGRQRVLLYPTSNSLAVENNPSLNDAGMILGNPDVLTKNKTLGANALVQQHNEKGAIKVSTRANACILSVARGHSSQALDGRTDIAVAPQNMLEWLRTQDLPKRDAKFYERVDGKWNPVARRTTNNYRPILVKHKGEQHVLLYPTSNSLAAENNPSLNDAGMILGNPDVLAKNKTLGANALVQQHNEKGAIKVSIQKGAILHSVAPVDSSQSLDGRTDIAIAPQNVLEWLSTQDLPKHDVKFYERVDGKWNLLAQATTNNYRPILIKHKGEQRVLLYPTSNSLAAENNSSLNDAGMILGNPDVLAKRDTLGADALVQQHNEKGAIKVSIRKKAILKSVKVEDKGKEGVMSPAPAVIASPSLDYESAPHLAHVRKGKRKVTEKPSAEQPSSKIARSEEVHLGEQGMTAPSTSQSSLHESNVGESGSETLFQYREGIGDTLESTLSTQTTSTVNEIGESSALSSIGSQEAILRASQEVIGKLKILRDAKKPSELYSNSITEIKSLIGGDNANAVVQAVREGLKDSSKVKERELLDTILSEIPNQQFEGATTLSTEAPAIAYPETSHPISEASFAAPESFLSMLGKALNSDSPVEVDASMLEECLAALTQADRPVTDLHVPVGNSDENQIRGFGASNESPIGELNLSEQQIGTNLSWNFVQDDPNFIQQQAPPFPYFQESLSSGTTLQSPLSQNPIGGSWESGFPIPGANAPRSSYQYSQYFRPQNSSNESLLSRSEFVGFTAHADSCEEERIPLFDSLIQRQISDQRVSGQRMEKEMITEAPSSNIANNMIELFSNSSQFIDPAQKHMPPIGMHETSLMHPAIRQQISGSEEPLNQQWRESSQPIAQQVTSPGEADRDMLEALETMLNPVHLQTTFAEPSQKPLHYQNSPDDAGNIFHNWTLTQIDTDSSMPRETSPLLPTLGHQIGALDETFNPTSFLRDPESPETLQLPAQRVASHAGAPAPYHWMHAPELPTNGAGGISISQALSLLDNLPSSLAMSPGEQRRERGTRIPSPVRDPRRHVSGAYSTDSPRPTSERGGASRSGR